MTQPAQTQLADSIFSALASVQDPELHRPVTELGMIAGVQVSDTECVIELQLTIASCPAADRIVRDVERAASQVAGIGARQVRVRRGVMSAAQRRELVERVRGGTGAAKQFGPGSLTRVIAVTSGKGGVGKSSLTAGIAVALTELGFRVGVVDADVYGFSQPRLLGATGLTPTRVDNLIIPPEVNGIKVISIGMFLGEQDPTRTAVSWRGPLLHRTLEQFLRDVWFGDIDFLLLDMPPGTGDVALSVTQLLPQAEVLVVTTPQPAASDVAVRSGLLAQQAGQRVLGVVENMSAVRLSDGSEFAPFGAGGGELVAKRLGEVTGEPDCLLAQVPFAPEFGRACDAGQPLGEAGAGAADSPDAVPDVTIAASTIRELAAIISHRSNRAELGISPS